MDLSGEALISQRSQRDIASGPAESLDWMTGTIAALLEQTSHRSKDHRDRDRFAWSGGTLDR
ncbi:hypothetical protein [Cryobacterium sp. Y82]|uniref:hypothetical protein n=1 Tax=Cryobacterium sp. Y82 TaxID=2045017 RepID=UPI00130482FD|nr:hypothetical protein [Cryobacterium sp. Y82]